MPSSSHGPQGSYVGALPVEVREIVAGGVAGALGKSSVAPLERVKIMMQTGNTSQTAVSQMLSQIYQKEGVTGLFRGDELKLARIGAHHPAWAGLRSTCNSFPRSRAVGCLLCLQLCIFMSQIEPGDDVDPGATAVLFTYPLDLVRTRFAYSMDAVPRGHGVPNPAQLLPPKLASTHASLHATQLAAQMHSASGAQASQRAMHVASVRPPSALLLQPGSRPAARAHMAAAAAPPRSAGTISSMVATVIRQEGLRGLYAGMAPTMIGILPYAGLKWFAYQSLKQQYWRTWGDAGPARGEHVGGVQSQRKLPVLVMLTFGGISALFGQTATYPIDVVRRRMQVQGIMRLQSGAASGVGGAMSPHDPAWIRSTWHGLTSIAQREGVGALFRGLRITYMKVVPSTAVGFTTYDVLKEYFGLTNNIT